MDARKWCRRVVVAAFIGLFAAGSAFAQPADAGAPGGRGGRGGGGLDRIKEALGATDQEWTAIQPRVEKVIAAQQEAAIRRMGRRGGQATAGAPEAQQSAVQKAVAELRTLLENKDAAPAEVTAKLTALRDAQKKAAVELTAAQASLKEVLTPRQEALLVLQGTLE